MFRRRPPKVVIELNSEEIRLMRTALLNFRSKVLAAGKPTEDIDGLILMITK